VRIGRGQRVRDVLTKDKVRTTHMMRVSHDRRPSARKSIAKNESILRKLFGSGSSTGAAPAPSAPLTVTFAAERLGLTLDDDPDGGGRGVIVSEVDETIGQGVPLMSAVLALNDEDVSRARTPSPAPPAAPPPPPPPPPGSRRARSGRPRG